MLMCAQTHGCAYVQPHTPTHPYVYTSMYAHVRTYTRTRRKFSDSKSALQHCQTEFHHQSDSIHFYYPFAVQFIFILAPHWLRNLYKLPSFVAHFPLIYHSLSHIYINFQTIYHSFNHPFIHLSLISYSFPISSYLSTISHASYSIFIRFPFQPTILSICQSVINPCQFSIYYPHSHIRQFLILYRLVSLSTQLHYYNHFHYGNRIPSQSSAFPIMHNYSSELYNYSFELHKYSFI